MLPSQIIRSCTAFPPPTPSARGCVAIPLWSLGACDETLWTSSSRIAQPRRDRREREGYGLEEIGMPETLLTVDRLPCLRHFRKHLNATME